MGGCLRLLPAQCFTVLTKMQAATTLTVEMRKLNVTNHTQNSLDKSRLAVVRELYRQPGFRALCQVPVLSVQSTRSGQVFAQKSGERGVAN